MLRGGVGNDGITYSGYANNTVEGGAGNDVLMVSNGNNPTMSNTLVGGAGDDQSPVVRPAYLGFRPSAVWAAGTIVIAKIEFENRRKGHGSALLRF